MYYSTKNYPPSIGLSCCFRQWKAESHCRLLHGYSLGFRFKFAARYLDENGWVVDFGGLKELKDELVLRFDHKMLIARNDPLIEQFMALRDANAVDVVVVSQVGAEAFAAQMFGFASKLINDNRVRVVSCECYEHDANSAICEEDK